MLNVVVRDMEASVEFYRRLGVAVPDDVDGTGHHAQLRMPSGFSLELDTAASARIWHAGWRADPGSVRIVIGFARPTGEAVDHKPKRSGDLRRLADIELRVRRRSRRPLRGRLVAAAGGAGRGRATVHRDRDDRALTVLEALIAKYDAVLAEHPPGGPVYRIALGRGSVVAPQDTPDDDLGGNLLDS